MSDPSCIHDARAILGEGPLWRPESQSLLWVDIMQNLVFCYDTRSGEKRVWEFPEPVTSIVETSTGDLYATQRDGFGHLNLADSDLEVIARPDKFAAADRFNDGKVDALGRYWAGTMDNLETSATGALYCWNGESLCTRESNIIITNGPAFSPDGTTLYHTDTLARTIYQYRLSPDSSLSDKKPFAVIADDAGYPDGMTVDAEGCLWVCHFGGWRISRYSATGALVGTVPMPVANITSCTFGGEDFRDLFITTARKDLTAEQLAEQPLAGGLFHYRPGVQGMAANFFQPSTLAVSGTSP